MHVVVTEASFGESGVVVEALREAGQYVSTCHEWSGVCQVVAGKAGAAVRRMPSHTSPPVEAFT